MRIAITGPESSGKTTLAIALAKHFSVEYVHEFAREFGEKSGGVYVQEDLDYIAQEHAKNIELSQNSIQIIDTEFISLKIWSDYRFHSTSKKIMELIENYPFDLFILCTPEMPWESDPLRVNPLDREKLFESFKKELNAYKKNHIIVIGHHEDRMKDCIATIQSFLK